MCAQRYARLQKISGHSQERVRSFRLENPEKRFGKTKIRKIPVAGQPQGHTKPRLDRVEYSHKKGGSDYLNLSLDFVEDIALVLRLFVTNNQLFAFLSEVLLVDVIN